MTGFPASDVLLADATRAQLARELFLRHIEGLRQGLPPLEDMREADWRFLLPLPRNSRVLLIGSDAGATALLLAKQGLQVSVLDPDVSKLAFLVRRAVAENLSITTHLPCKLDDWPHGPFDTIAVFAARFVGVELEPSELLSALRRRVGAGGQIFLNVPNSLGFTRFLGRAPSTLVKAQSLAGWRRSLVQADFAVRDVYALLPFYDQTPMFQVPLSAPEGLRFFLKNVFPLFESISPEVKARHKLEYTLAKLAVRSALTLHLEGLLPLGFSGFSFVAERVM